MIFIKPYHSSIFMHTTRHEMSLLWTTFYFSLQPMHLSSLWWSVVISYYLYGRHTQGPPISHSPIVRGFMRAQREDGMSPFPPRIHNAVQRPVCKGCEMVHLREIWSFWGRCNKWMLISENMFNVAVVQVSVQQVSFVV